MIVYVMSVGGFPAGEMMAKEICAHMFEAARRGQENEENLCQSTGFLSN